MKTILSALAIAACSTALAVESSNTFGILRVDSTAAQTIVSVPWENAGGGAIKVKDVVKTANLTVGDQLYYYANGGYKMWVLTQVGDAIVWSGAQSVKGENGGVIDAAEGDESTLVRGGALILVRQRPAMPFYLYGQYATAGSSTTCVAGGYTLLAPPSTGVTDLNTKTWSDVNAADNIVLADGTLLSYRDSKWGKLTKTLNSTTGVIAESVDTDVAQIAAGEGAWYISKGSTAPSVVWIAEPVQD